MNRVGPTVFLDACVLYSIVLCDALLTAAKLGLFRLTWSRRVEDEWLAAAVRNGPHSMERLLRRRDAMRRARPDWEAASGGAASAVDASAADLPDPDDAHVIAAAVSAQADCIVTLNLQDFPKSVLSRLGLRALHPDAFLAEQFDRSPLAMAEAFEHLRRRLKHPPLGIDEFLDNWIRHGLPRLAARLTHEAAFRRDGRDPRERLSAA